MLLMANDNANAAFLIWLTGLIDVGLVYKDLKGKTNLAPFGEVMKKFLGKLLRCCYILCVKFHPIFLVFCRFGLPRKVRLETKAIVA